MMHFNESCSCHKNGLCIDSRHLSWTVAIIILLFSLFFVSGYFVGKRKTLQDMHDTVVQESFADKIYASLCSMQHNPMTTLYDQPYEETEEQECVMHKASVDVPVKIQMVDDVALDEDTVKDNCVQKEHAYYAQLIGFGTREAAQKFAFNLQKQNIPIMIKERISKTAKGKKIAWYQVITELFKDKNKLQVLVNKQQSKEHLRVVSIITC